MAKKKQEEVAVVGDNKATKIFEEKEYYKNQAQGKRSVWTQCYKHYNSFLDQVENPFLANMFIPKSHEAVELLTAFLIGANQTIQVEPEGKDDVKKAEVVKKWLDFVWRKIIRARDYIITWIKQSLIFSNGIIKVGWDAEKQYPFIQVVDLTEVYFDYYTKELQDSYSVLHRLTKTASEIKKDERYNKEVRENVVASDAANTDQTQKGYETYDDSSTILQNPNSEVEFFEHYCKEEGKITTIIPTGNGWQIAREITFEEAGLIDADGQPFYPFVKMRCKTSPLPNRAYDMGILEPTLKVQKAYNDMVNEIFDNVTLINNKMWITRIGAQINPMDLVRRPGGHIRVGNINTDIKPEEVGDIKQSAMEMLKILDNEFQQASGVIDLLKGIPGADTATEAVMGQRNATTLIDMLDDNVKDALAELGEMLVNLMIKNALGSQVIKVLDNEKEVGWLEFSPDEVQGKYDIKIIPDRGQANSQAVKQKQLIDFSNLVKSDPIVMSKYPTITEKIYKKWLEEAGYPDSDYFFDETEQTGQGMNEGMLNLNQQIPGQPANLGQTTTREGLSEMGIERGVMSPDLQQPQV